MTSIEWLIQVFAHNDIIDHNLLSTREDKYKLYKRLSEQAKEMHKQEIINTWSEATALDHEIGLSDTSYIIAQIERAEQYYNETFKNQQQ